MTGAYSDRCTIKRVPSPCQASDSEFCLVFLLVDLSVNRRRRCQRLEIDGETVELIALRTHACVEFKLLRAQTLGRDSDLDLRITRPNALSARRAA